MIKKILMKTLNAVSILLILCSVGVLLSVVLTKKGEAPNVLGYSLFRVMTGSMEPTIPTDSLIAVKKTDPAKLKVGDVISFYSRDPSLMGEVNTHRIVAIEQQDGRYYFATKGDANNVEDQYATVEDDVIGKVFFNSYNLGKVIRLLSNPLVFIPIIILPLVYMLGHSIYESMVIAAKLAKEEEEAAVREALEIIRRSKEELAKEEEEGKKEEE